MQKKAEPSNAPSWWESDVFLPMYDVLIIGSGIVGLSAALHLAAYSPRLKVAVVERGSLPLGASTRNAGFACFGSMTELLADADQHSEAAMLGLVERRWRGLQGLRQRVGEQAMHYQGLGGYEVFRRGEEESFQRCADQLSAINKQLASITGLPETFTVVDERIEQFGFQSVEHLILNRAEGQLHPGLMMKTLLGKARAAGVTIFKGFPVDWIEEQEQHLVLHSPEGLRLQGQKVLVATNGFASTLLPELDLQPVRNQVLITRPIAGLKVRACFHYDRGFYYFRNVGNRLLIGGGRHLRPEEEQTDQLGLTPPIQQALQAMLDQIVLPEQAYEIEARWSGILGVGGEKKPIVKQVGERIFVAVRLGGMGVAIGTLVGEEGAELLLNGVATTKSAD
ncbi:MAG: FAD-dependent oxidoreductase [Bacteroidota bacterium]